MKRKQYTILEILKTLKEEIEKGKYNYLEGGYVPHQSICFCISFLHRHKKITIKESEMVVEYMRKNPPENVKNVLGYWFPQYEKEPRLKWIQEHIKKNSQQ